MSISPVSNVSSYSGPQAVQSHTPASKSSTPSSSGQPADTVSLSPEAQAMLQGGGDVDHDGDSH